MTAIEKYSIGPGDDGLANPISHKLRGFIPGAVAMSYPFWLDGFHLAVSASNIQISAVRILGAALCLVVALATPFVGLACALRMTNAFPSSFELRARRLAYVTVGVPPFFVLTGVGLGLLHIHLSDEFVWVAGWLMAGSYLMFGNGERPAARPISAAPSIAKWRVAHGAVGALVLGYVLFHLTNHILGLLGPGVHATVMKAGRLVYRSPVVEPVLI